MQCTGCALTVQAQFKLAFGFPSMIHAYPNLCGSLSLVFDLGLEFSGWQCSPRWLAILGWVFLGSPSTCTSVIQSFYYTKYVHIAFRWSWKREASCGIDALVHVCPNLFGSWAWSGPSIFRATALSSVVDNLGVGLLWQPFNLQAIQDLYNSSFWLH